MAGRIWPTTVDLETGAVVALTVQPADRGDTESMPATLSEAGCTVTEMAGQAARADAVGPVETVSEVGVERVVGTRVTTASRRCRIWPRWACARWSRSRNASGKGGPDRVRHRRRCMRIVGGWIPRPPRH